MNISNLESRDFSHVSYTYELRRFFDGDYPEMDIEYQEAWISYLEGKAPPPLPVKEDFTVDNTRFIITFDWIAYFNVTRE